MMPKLIGVLVLLMMLPALARPAVNSLQPPTATPGPTEVVGSATPPPTIIQPTAKPPRPTHTPTATPSATRTATTTRTPTRTPTPALIYQLHLGDNWLEAERPTDADASAWQIRDDGAASAGHYLIAAIDDAGTLEYRFSLDYAGTIYIWLRATRSPVTEKPIRIRLDSRGDDPATVRSTSWAWTLDDDAAYDIQPGLHTFRIEALAAGVQIDALLITTNRTTTP